MLSALKPNVPAPRGPELLAGSVSCKRLGGYGLYFQSRCTGDTFTSLYIYIRPHLRINKPLNTEGQEPIQPEVATVIRFCM